MPVESRDDLVKRLRQQAKNRCEHIGQGSETASAEYLAAIRIQSDAKRIAELEAKERESFQKFVDANEDRITAERALAEERERCALIAEEFGIGRMRSTYGGTDIATTIRSGKPDGKE